MKNKYEIHGEETSIFIEYKDHTLEALIDTEDLPRIINVFGNYEGFTVGGKWYAIYAKSADAHYVYRSYTVAGKSCSVALHRYITGCPQGLDVDHINRNPLDNRKCNLRVCTRSVNNRNRKYKNTALK